MLISSNSNKQINIEVHFFLSSCCHKGLFFEKLSILSSPKFFLIFSLLRYSPPPLFFCLHNKMFEIFKVLLKHTYFLKGTTKRSKLICAVWKEILSPLINHQLLNPQWLTTAVFCLGKLCKIFISYTQIMTLIINNQKSIWLCYWVSKPSSRCWLEHWIQHLFEWTFTFRRTNQSKYTDFVCDISAYSNSELPKLFLLNESRQ